MEKYQNESGINLENKLSELSQISAMQDDIDATYKPSVIQTIVTEVEEINELSKS